MKTCSVGWCLALPAAGYSSCAQHTKRPVLSPDEKPDAYMLRMRREDAASRRRAEAAARKAERNAERAAQKAGARA